MTDTIVVGTDGSDTAKQAVAEAVRLARAFEAELHIVTAFKGVQGARIVGAPEGAAQVWALLPDTLARTVVEEAAASIRVAGVEPHFHLVERDPADALLEVASKVGATLIVVGSQGMTGARRLLGSVPNKISHDAHCNVLIVATSKGAG